MRKIYILTMMFLLVLFSINAQKKHVMIVAKTSTDAFSLQMIDSLKADFNVASTDIIDEATFKVAAGTYSTAAGYAGYDLVIFTESPGSSAIANFSIAKFPIPCINLKCFALKNNPNWGLISSVAAEWLPMRAMAADTATNMKALMDSAKLVIKNNHAIWGGKYTIGQKVEWSNSYTAGWGLGAGQLQTYNLAMSTGKKAGGSFMAKSTPLGYFAQGEAKANDGMYSMWATETNDTTKRMVSWGIHQSFYFDKRTTADFWWIIRNSALWATGQNPKVVTAINNINAAKPLISPNPVKNILTATGATKIEIIDIKGSQVLSANADKINVSTLKNGIYCVKATINNKTHISKIVKE